MALLPHLITSHYIVSTQVETSSYINYYQDRPQIPTVLTLKKDKIMNKEKDTKKKGNKNA
jgi:hypothetical protein